MSTNVWNFVINTFLVATANSYRLAVRIAKDHDAALFAGKADPNVNAQYTLFHPLYLNMVSSYELWLSQEESQLGDTLSLQLALKQLSSTKIKNWDIKIQNVFTNDTPDYKKLLPYHRSPFQSGSQNDKITALAALSTNLTDITTLAAVKLEIDAFLDNLKTIQGVAHVALKKTSNHSTSVEDARVAMCNKMFGNYGRLLGFNEDNPTSIMKYFPIKYIQNRNQIVFMHIIKPSVRYNVVKHTFLPDDQILITNNAATSFMVYLSLTKDDKKINVGLTVLGNTQVTVDALALGDVENNHFLMVVNLSHDMSADFEIEFL